MNYKTVNLLISVFIFGVSLAMFMASTVLSLIGGINISFLLAVIAIVIFVMVGSVIECKVSPNGEKKLIKYVIINSVGSLLGTVSGLFMWAVLALAAVMH
jgi:hypothetical protein